MPTIYSVAPEDVSSAIAAAAEQYHPHLAEAGVTITAMFAASTNGAPALKLHGWPCHAIVKVNSLKDRAEGKADATVTIDKETWDDADDKRRVALIDHELTHLTLVRDKKTNLLKLDDLGRPRLKVRLHDYQCGIFKEVAARHKDDAYDTEALGEAVAILKQLAMPWG